LRQKIGVGVVRKKKRLSPAGHRETEKWFNEKNGRRRVLSRQSKKQKLQFHVGSVPTGKKKTVPRLEGAQGGGKKGETTLTRQGRTLSRGPRAEAKTDSFWKAEGNSEETGRSSFPITAAEDRERQGEFKKIQSRSTNSLHTSRLDCGGKSRQEETRGEREKKKGEMPLENSEQRREVKSLKKLHNLITAKENQKVASRIPKNKKKEEKTSLLSD